MNAENKDSTDNVMPYEISDLKYSEYLAPFEDDVYKVYAPKTVTLYRTVLEVPPNERDNTPQKMRSDKNPYTASDNLQPDTFAKLNDKQRLDLVGDLGLSFNDSLDAAINSALTHPKYKVVRGRKKNLPDDVILKQIMQYAENNRGLYVAKFDFTPLAGIFSEVENGHCNMLPYKYVNIEDYRDKDFKPVKIDYLSVLRDA